MSSLIFPEIKKILKNVLSAIIVIIGVDFHSLHCNLSPREVILLSIYVTLSGFAQTWKTPGFDLGPGKLLEFEKRVFCPGIVLEFCKITLENMS